MVGQAFAILPASRLADSAYRSATGALAAYHRGARDFGWSCVRFKRCLDGGIDDVCADQAVPAMGPPRDKRAHAAPRHPNDACIPRLVQFAPLTCPVRFVSFRFAWEINKEGNGGRMGACGCIGTCDGARWSKTGEMCA